MPPNIVCSDEPSFEQELYQAHAFTEPVTRVNRQPMNRVEHDDAHPQEPLKRPPQAAHSSTPALTSRSLCLPPTIRCMSVA